MRARVYDFLQRIQIYFFYCVGLGEYWIKKFFLNPNLNPNLIFFFVFFLAGGGDKSK